MRDDGENIFISYTYNYAIGEYRHTIYEWDKDHYSFAISETASIDELNSRVYTSDTLLDKLNQFKKSRR
ncbi:MAG TPA: hypothetical protein VHP81_03030 [Lachnospiraceae bacterium]|nr:hypothetical protein [Lachnospiraceae bacterium]